jgi:hypothetical protein
MPKLAGTLPGEEKSSGNGPYPLRNRSSDRIPEVLEQLVAVADEQGGLGGEGVFGHAFEA